MRKRFILSLILSSLLVLLAASLAYGQSNDKLARLSSRIEKILRSSPLKKAKVGVQVISLADGKQIFARQP